MQKTLPILQKSAKNAYFSLPQAAFPACIISLTEAFSPVKHIRPGRIKPRVQSILSGGDAMFSVRIAEGGSKKILPYVKRCLKEASREGRIDAALCSGGHADLLIVPRGAEAGSAGCLLLAGGQEAAPGQRAVRCGLGAGDQLSLSSIGRGSAMLSLQGELTTLGGTRLEQQEIPLALRGSPEPEAVLAAAGAMLLLDADPARGLRLT